MKYLISFISLTVAAGSAYLMVYVDHLPKTWHTELDMIALCIMMLGSIAISYIFLLSGLDG